MKRTLIVLVAALAVLGLILIKKNRVEQSMQSDAFVLDTAGAAKATSLSVIKKPDTARLEKKDGNWVVSKDGFTVDTAKINKVLGYLFKLQDKEKVSESKERLAEYGMDSSEAKHIRLGTGSGKTVEVVIGKTSGADYSSTYWKWEGKPAIYRTPGNFSWEIGVKDQDWKQRKLFSAGPKDVKFIETTWQDSTGKSYSYKLEAVTDSTWKMLVPEDSNRVKNALASEMAARFADMSIDDFVNSNDTNLAKVKLDTPMVRIKIGLKNGTTHELKAGTLIEGFYYSLHPARPDTIKLAAWRFDSFRKMPFELLEAPPPPKADSAKSAGAAQPGAAAGNGAKTSTAKSGVNASVKNAPAQPAAK